MITDNFIAFVERCLSGDLRTREIRLSDEEREFVSGKYAFARFIPLENMPVEDGKTWYEVSVSK